MNAERLHAIALAVNADLAEVRAVELIAQVQQALQNLVNAPQDASAQQALSNAVQQLRQGLANAPSNAFSPSWRETLAQLGIDDVLGDRLRTRIDAIIGANAITPTVALEQVEPIASRIGELQAQLTALVASLQWLTVGREVLGPGEAEVGLMIPREAIDDSLERLGRECLWLRRALGPFLELTTGSRPDIRVSTIASSDFQMYVHMVPVAAAAVAHGIERLINGYKTVLEIRKLRNEYAEQDGPPDVLDAMEKDAGQRITVVINGIVEEMTVNYSTSGQPDGGRSNELLTDLKNSLEGFANRIDRGYGVDVRVGELPQEESEDQAALPADVIEAINVIRSAAQALQYLNVGGQPILQLPEGKTTSEDDEPGESGAP